MERDDVAQEKKDAEFARYKCEIVDVLESYYRLFARYGIEIPE